MPIKIYLNVPFSQKDDAKKIGARWDNEKKQWWIFEGTASPDKYTQWVGELPTKSGLPTLPPTPTDEELSSRFLIAPIWLSQSYTHCWKCGESTVVHCLTASGMGGKENEEDGFGIVNISNLKAVVSQIAAEIKKFAPNYHIGFSKTLNGHFFINHCQQCNSNQGDFFLHNEPGGAFFSMAASAVERIKIATSGKFGYVGDWHSSGDAS